MMDKSKAEPDRRQVTALAAALGALFASGQALAGECPSGSSGVDLMKPGATKPKGVADKVIGSIDLARERVKLAGYKLRMRRLVVAPGGEVPWHSHEDRPALIYILAGAITEFKSTCAVPIRHTAGSLAVEDHQVSHWWKNMEARPCVILSFDLFHEMQDPHMM